MLGQVPVLYLVRLINQQVGDAMDAAALKEPDCGSFHGKQQAFNEPQHSPALKPATACFIFGCHGAFSYSFFAPLWNLSRMCSEREAKVANPTNLLVRIYALPFTSGRMPASPSKLLL